MDVVYTFLAEPSANSEELRYSLRSLKNIPHRNVYIVGDAPSWVRNVIHVPVPQVASKQVNIRANLLAAIDRQELSNDFIYMNDDFFIMKPIPHVPALHYGDMKRLIHQFENEKLSGPKYIAAMRATYELLRLRGMIEPYSYELHTPMVLNKRRLRTVITSLNDEVIQFRSVYGNTFSCANAMQTGDVKIFSDMSLNNHNYSHDPEGYIRNQVFLSVSDDAFCGEAGNIIRSIFHEPSMYESDSK